MCDISRDGAEFPDTNKFRLAYKTNIEIIVLRNVISKYRYQKSGDLRPPPHPKMSILVRFFVFLISSACDRAWC